jgi:hypothetical protein
MRITAYLNSSKERMYDIGLAAGLDGDALDYFMFALYEVKIEMEVDPATGKATIVAVDGRELK